MLLSCTLRQPSLFQHYGVVYYNPGIAGCSSDMLKAL